jgi:hypothetical protein
MVLYQNGKIYKIYCNITFRVYYGSTCETLARRLTGHKSDYKCYLKDNKKKKRSSFMVLENDNFVISLVEEISCQNKMQLLQRERFYIENNICVNKNIPSHTKKESYNYYRIVNADRLKESWKEYSKTYSIINAEKIKEKKKEYSIANADRLKEYQKEYREKKKIK